jgi:dolichyl-phosphate-mannose--protein O-mannosyl transferase
VLARLFRWKSTLERLGAVPPPPAPTDASPVASPVGRLGELPLPWVALLCGLLPFFVYWLSWQPHLAIFPQHGFLEYNKMMYDAHKATKGPEAHAYCSHFYTWPFMVRPVAYYYQTEDVPADEPGAPPAKIVRDIHAMANPAVVWLSTVALLGISLTLAWQKLERLRAPAKGARDASGGWLESALQLYDHRLAPEKPEIWGMFFLVANYVANMLPWIGVKRCLFFYHYMEAYVFAILALAFLVESWSQSLNDVAWQVRGQRVRAGDLFLYGVVAIVGVAFELYLPLFIGLPITNEQFYRLMFVTSWI